MPYDLCTTDAFLRQQCDPGRGLLIASPLSGEGPWHTRTVVTNDGQLTVLAPRDSDGPLVRHPGSLLMLQIPTGQALYRVPCTLLDKTPVGDPLWTLGDFGSVERVQRRAAYRYRGAFGVELLPSPRQPDALCHFTLPPNTPRNISTTGVYLQGKTALPLGSQVTTILHLDSREDPIRLDAEVVRHDSLEPGLIGHGLAFCDIDRSTQRTITRFIARQERRWV